MRINRTLATSSAVLVAMGIATGTANAEPVQPPSPDDTTISVDILPGVHYTSDVTDRSVVLNSGFGALTTKGDQFQVVDARGDLVAGTPLTVQGDVATAVAPFLPLNNVDASADFNGALGVAATQFGLATGVGAMVGGLVGLGVGCVAGGLTGGFVALPTGPIAAPAALFGCILGGSTGAGLGAVVGGALVGIPVGIASAVQMYNTLHAAGDVG